MHFHSPRNVQINTAKKHLHLFYPRVAPCRANKTQRIKVGICDTNQLIILRYN